VLPGAADFMRAIEFTKVESIGNDFVLVDADAFPSDRDLRAFVVGACARRLGIGSDGLLALRKGPGPGELDLRMFNPDGTEDFCGNGLRCAARYAVDRGWVGGEFVIHHLGRDVEVSTACDLVSTTIGVATFEPTHVPLAASKELFDGCLDVAGETLTVSALSTGSTHTVIFVDALPSDARFLALSPLIENHELFPQRTSVIWTQHVGDLSLRLRIWERAVGETLGCGSGSSAAAAVLARKLGRGGTVQVESRGGTVRVSMEDWRSPITVAGTARVVYTGEWPIATDAT